MRYLTNLIGIILIIIGVVTLGYRGYTYTTQEKVAQIGPIEVTSEQHKTVSFPPLLGTLSFVGGIVLVVVARVGRPKK